MLHILLALGLVASPEIYGDNLLYPDHEDYVSGSGTAAGLFAYQVCTQTADDTTPGVGFGYGPLGLGCNIIIMNGSNTGATAITTFDGVPSSVPGTPGSILYVVGPATAANPTTIADSGNFELEYAWSAAGSGQETRVLVLECITTDTFVEVTRHNGIRYFDDKVLLGGGLTLGDDLDLADYDIKNPSQIYREAPTTDAAPTNMDLIGENAYAESTGGNQTGADINIASGIGVRQITIDDFNNCAGDTVTLTIDGADTVCTEAGGGCTWTAATDNATTATSLAAGIDAVSGVSASATAAVVYITPDDDDTLAVDLAEGDATCTTLTEGTDGSIVLSAGHAALAVEPDGDILVSGGDVLFAPHNTHAIGGTSAMPASIYAATAIYGGTMQAGAGSAIKWSTRAKLMSPTDGNVIVANAAGTQGIYFDTATTANELYLTDESGNAASVKAATFTTYHATLPGSLTRDILSFNAGDGVVTNISTTGNVSLYSRSSNAASARGTANVGSGNNTNAGDYATGNTTIYTGDTTTDGDTGDVILKSGAAGAGAADAGDILLQVHGANTKFTLFGATGDITITGTIKTEVAVGDAPAEPHACDAAHSGVIVTVDDTNDTAWDEPCVCLNLDGTGYDWRQLSDVSGTACTDF